MQEYSEVIIHEVDLEKLIEKSGKSITKIAEEVGITRAYIYMVLNGKVRMSEQTWEKLKKAL